MEANSLASVNLLASNPPQYPENPSEEKREPLILYISRVPGTRDVILSPFKPQIKNVTGGDVASSLYYVHYELPSSQRSSPTPAGDAGRRTSSEDSSRARVIPRKPIPSSASSLSPENPNDGDELLQQLGESRQYETSRLLNSLEIAPNSRQSESGLTATTAESRERRSRGLSNASDMNLIPNPELLVSVPKRKPLGPRPPGSAPNDNFDQLLPPQSQTQLAVQDPLTENQGRSRANSTGFDRNSRSLSPKKRIEYVTPPFTLSLIRRDPGTGDQWNVGKISSYEIETLADSGDRSSAYLSANTEPQSSQYPPIDLQIETSGYARFRSMHPKRSIDADPMGSHHSLERASVSRYDGGVFFSRQVFMSYGKSWTSTLKSKFQQMGQSAREKAHGRHGSEASVNSAGSTDFTVGSPPPSVQPEKLKARGYVFSSPWDTRCEFRTGNGGRSLLCHHFQQESQTNAYNPLVADTAANAPKPASAVVSELRFNLPNSDLLPSNNTARDFKDRQLGHFNKLLKEKAGIDLYEHPEDEEDEDDVPSPFEVNVGSERAGGGNRGKRAKLGKLILYHDGLKMLDLLVAANMGMWWGVWERSF